MEELLSKHRRLYGNMSAIFLPFLPFKANAIREPDNVLSEELFTSLRSWRRTASHLQATCKQNV